MNGATVHFLALQSRRSCLYSFFSRRSFSQSLRSLCSAHRSARSVAIKQQSNPLKRNTSLLVSLVYRFTRFLLATSYKFIRLASVMCRKLVHFLFFPNFLYFLFFTLLPMEGTGWGRGGEGLWRLLYSLAILATGFTYCYMGVRNSLLKLMCFVILRTWHLREKIDGGNSQILTIKWALI